MNKNIWIPKFNYYSKRLSMWQEKLWREVNGKPFMGILDNIAGRKTFEYATFGRSGIQQSNSKLFSMEIEPMVVEPMYMTAACVWNASNAIPKDSGLTTTIDRGRRVNDADSTGSYYTYGYAVSNEWFENVTGFGTMANSTYTDGGSTSRTIKGVVYYEVGGLNSDDFVLSIDGTSVSNSDTTWLDLTWDDIAGTPRTMDRDVDTTTYTASLNGSTHWRDLASPWNWSDLDAGTDFVLTTS